MLALSSTVRDGQDLDGVRAPKRCVYRGCSNVGQPEPGYNFYACGSCLDETFGYLISLSANAAQAQLAREIREERQTQRST